MYNQPDFTALQIKHITGAISVATAVDSAYVGSTLRTFTKAVIVGVTVRVGSGGSAAGTNSFRVARINALGTVSNMQIATVAMSAGASAAGDVIAISLTTPFTVHSFGEGAVLVGHAASLDKVAVLSDVEWRYRFLPSDQDPFNSNRG